MSSARPRVSHPPQPRRPYPSAENAPTTVVAPRKSFPEQRRLQLQQDILKQKQGRWRNQRDLHFSKSSLGFGSGFEDKTKGSGGQKRSRKYQRLRLNFV